MDDILLTSDKLDVTKVTELAGCPTCGAISTFIGTTRDHFKGKTVVCLEYEAYVPMAELEVKKICKSIRDQWDVKHIVVHHRLGQVPIGEASIIIAISSCHRKESLAALEYAIDTLKAKVPVWKREVYSDGTCSWKENAECCWSNKMKE